jgi:hypothetical protein
LARALVHPNHRHAQFEAGNGRLYCIGQPGWKNCASAARRQNACVLRTCLSIAETTSASGTGFWTVRLDHGDVIVEFEERVAVHEPHMVGNLHRFQVSVASLRRTRR